MKYLRQSALGLIIGFVLFFTLKIIVAAIIVLFIVAIAVVLWIYFKPAIKTNRYKQYL